MKKMIIPLLCITGSVLAASAKPDSDMKSVLDALKAKNGKPIETLTATEARIQPTPAEAAIEVTTKAEGKYIPTPVAKVEDKEISGADGKILARIYTPTGNKPMPIIVYYHGGGFVIATNETYDSTPRALASGTKAIVVAVEYRKAPENKFPAAHDDAIAAYKWVLENSKSLGGDPARIAVAGESAGGNLALNVAIMARDQKLTIPTHELLIYPLAGTDMNTASYKKNEYAAPLSKAMVGWFVKQYTNSPEDLKDKRINLMAADFHGLNPATIITAEIDPLMNDGKALAQKMKEQGVTVEYKNYEGVTHEFFGMAPAVSEAKAAQKLATSNLSLSFTTKK